LIVDEIQTGMGRTGKFFAIDHWDIEPDIITMAKGLASGLPLGAIISKASVMNWKPGSHASTFGGNPVSCAASLATVQLLERGLLTRVQKLGPYLGMLLKRLQDKHEVIGDVRGKGFMWGIECVKDRITKEKAIRERDRIIELAFKKGLLILGAGENSIRIVPPLTATKKELETAVEILDECLEKL
jgi:4-aminobutyrate aminotransferase